jgi:hypothetical protein
MVGKLPRGFGPVMPDVRPRSQIEVESNMQSQALADRRQYKHDAGCLPGDALTQKELAQ